MKILLLTPVILLSIQTSLAMGQTTTTPLAGPQARKFGQLPLSFEANEGQSDPQVQFTSRGDGYSLFLTDRAAVLELAKKDTTTSAAKTDVVRMELSGATGGVHVSGEDQLPGKANYFTGRDAARWHTDVPTYARVKYAGVYPGVDLVYYGNQRQLEYDFVIGQGADPRPVRLHFDGARKLRLDRNGDLTITAQNGELAFHKPVVYQVRDGRREPVEGRFQLLARNEVGFQLGRYDHSRILVIDPILAYSTYLTNAFSNSYVTVDKQGNLYVLGGPIPASTQFGSSCYISVGKYNAAGTALLYATCLGGSGGVDGGGADTGLALTTDESGNVYITGSTYSYDFPVSSNAFQTMYLGLENFSAPSAFVTKINAAGNALAYSTYLGGYGGGPDGFGCCPYGYYGTGIAVDSAGHAYVTGVAQAADFPVNGGQGYGPPDPTSGIPNAFLAEFYADGSNVFYSTYLGGSGTGAYTGDYATGVAVNAAGNAYVTGYASSPDFPTTSKAFQKTNKSSGTGYDAFVTDFAPDDSKLVYSTFLGGTQNHGFTTDGANAIALDKAGNAYVTGVAGSTNFPVTTGAFQTVNKASHHGTDAFVAKLNPTGESLVYSTFLGGSGNDLRGYGDAANGIALDPAGDVYLTGQTYSGDFPVTTDAMQPRNNAKTNAGSNAFLTKLNPTGSALLYSTYLGGTGFAIRGAAGGGDTANSIALDPAANVYIAGQAFSADYPVTRKPTFNSDFVYYGQPFLSKFAFGAKGIGTSVLLTRNPSRQKPDEPVTFTAHVKALSGDGIPTGTISGDANGGPLVTVPLNASGEASYTTESLPEGKFTIVATYSGDAKYAPSSADVTELVPGAPATLSFFQASGTGDVGTAFTVSVLVQDASGIPLPGVVVNFSGAGFQFSANSATTNGFGYASVSVVPEQRGDVTLTATVGSISASEVLYFFAD